MNLSSKEIETIEEITRLKLLEDRYLTLIRYLKLHCKKYNLITKEEVERIIEALGEDPIEELVEEVLEAVQDEFK